MQSKNQQDKNQIRIAQISNEDTTLFKNLDETYTKLIDELNIAKDLKKFEILENINKVIPKLSQINIDNLSVNNKQNFMRLRIKFLILIGETNSRAKIEDEKLRNLHRTISTNTFSLAFEALSYFRAIEKPISENLTDKSFYKAIYSFLSLLLKDSSIIKIEKSPEELNKLINDHCLYFYTKCSDKFLKLNLGYKALPFFCSNYESKLPHFFKQLEGLYNDLHNIYVNISKLKSIEDQLDYMEIQYLKVRINTLCNKNSIYVKYKPPINFKLISDAEMTAHLKLYRELKNHLDSLLKVLKNTDVKKMFSTDDLSFRYNKLFNNLLDLFNDFSTFYDDYLKANPNKKPTQAAYRNSSLDIPAEIMDQKQCFINMDASLNSFYSKAYNTKIVIPEKITNIILNAEKKNLDSRIETIKKELHAQTSSAKKHEDELIAAEKIENEKKEQKRFAQLPPALKKMDFDGDTLNKEFSSEEEFEGKELASNSGPSVANSELSILENRDKKLAHLADHIKSKIKDIKGILKIRKSTIEAPSPPLSRPQRLSLQVNLKYTITEYYKFFEECQILFALYENNKIKTIQEGIVWSKETLNNQLIDFHNEIHEIIQDFKLIKANNLFQKTELVYNKGKIKITEDGDDPNQCTIGYIKEQGINYYTEINKEKKEAGIKGSEYKAENRFFGNMNKYFVSLDWLNKNVRLSTNIKDDPIIIAPEKAKDSISYSNYQMHLGILLFEQSFEIKNELKKIHHFKYVYYYFSTLYETFKNIKDENLYTQAGGYMKTIKEEILEKHFKDYTSGEDIIELFNSYRRSEQMMGLKS